MTRLTVWDHLTVAGVLGILAGVLWLLPHPTPQTSHPCPTGYQQAGDRAVVGCEEAAR